ncbi:MAG TPA: alpha/beta hydrolase [Kineosporiaceae bacterium]|nr:alpha/beta hydrolase [Kineosporiaceae bacterium]
MVTLPPSGWADLDGPVHYVDFGGPDDGPLVVCVHGLGGSHANWLAIAPQLARSCRVVALDLAGFGLTRGGLRRTTVHANRELLHRFVTTVTGAPAILMGNSMGGMISALEAAAHPGVVAGAVLIDPALPVYLSSRADPAVAALFAAQFAPGAGSLFMRGRRRGRTAEQIAMDTLRLCCVDPRRIPQETVDAHLELARRRQAYTDMDREFVAATRSLVTVLAARRHYLAMLTRIRCPVLLLHGDSDRLVSVRTARRVAALNPSWRYEEADDVGHVPMLEAPDWTLDRITDWMARQGACAVEAARGAVAPEPALKDDRLVAE